MSRQSRKLHHLSMRMTIEQWQEPLWKGFKWKRKQKPPRPVLSGGIFSCLHTKDPRRRSIGFFYFPESLNICPDCRLSWDLNIWRLSFDINQEQLPFLGHSEFLRHIWRRRGVGLNMYWLWIEVKCRDPGFRHDRGGPVGEESSRDGVEIESKQHDISKSISMTSAADQAAWLSWDQPTSCHEIKQLGDMRSSN